uniref:uncharacterized protein isoform X3 n=1 Tax=Myxine glutinosa TaxID=7769 RepID=UPI00358EA477
METRVTNKRVSTKCPVIVLTENGIKKRKENARKWRAKMKENAEALNAFREQENQRMRDYRRRLSEEMKSHNRELQRERQRQYRLRKSRTEPQRKTRKRSERQRGKWREEKRRSRECMSVQKRVAINKKRREAYAAKKMKMMHSTKDNISLPSTPVNDAPVMIPTPANQLSSSAKRTAKSRYKRKLLQSLPKSSELKADVILAGIKSLSPSSKKRIKQKLGGALTPKKELFVRDSVAATMKNLGKSRSKRTLRQKRLLAEALMIKKRSLRFLRNVGVSRKVAKRVQECHLEHGWEDQRKKRGHALSREQIESIKNFYGQGDISSDIPNARSALKKDGIVFHRKVLASSLQTTYQQYRDQHPDINISYATFKRLRPINILPHTQHKFRECLCEYCINIELNLKAVNKIISEHQQPAIHISDKYAAAKLTTCSEVNGKPKKACLDRQCEECGTRLIQRHLRLVLTTPCRQTSWQRWEKTTVEGHPARMLKASKQGTVHELVHELLWELEPYASHLFNAKWQHNQYKNITSDIPPQTAILCLDFGENYTCRAGDAPQGYHWTNTQCTIHPVVANYICPQSDCSVAVTDSIIFISSDLKHDQHAVHHFTKRAVQMLKEEVPLDYIIQFSDGSPTQYKSKTNFSDCSFSSKDMGARCEKHFFGSRHGKGPCDSEIGVVKKSVRMAVAASQVTVSSPKELFEVSQARLSLPRHNDQHSHTKRRFVYVPKDEIERNRPDRSGVTPVKDTRKLHAVREIQPFVISAKERSCFCKDCKSGKTECNNKDLTGEWKTVRIVSTLQTVDDGEDVAVPVTPSVSNPPASTVPQQSLLCTLTEESEHTAAQDTQRAESHQFGDFVEVAFFAKGSRQSKIYVGVVNDIDDEGHELEVVFLRNRQIYFTYPDVQDAAWVPFGSIVQKLPPPTIDGRGRHTFSH